MLLPYKDEWDVALAAIPILYAAWRLFVTPFLKKRKESLRKQEELYAAVTDISTKLNALDAIVADLKPNSGSSLRDAIDRVEKMVIASNQAQRGILDLLNVGFNMTDYHGHVVYINRYLQRLSGLPLDEAVGTGWAAAVHPEDRARVVREWFDAVREERTFTSHYRVINTTTGVITPVFAHSVALKDSKGVVYGYIGTLVEEEPPEKDSP